MHRPEEEEARRATPEEIPEITQREWRSAQDALRGEEGRVAEAEGQAERRVAEAEQQAEDRVVVLQRQFADAVREARRKASLVRQAVAEAVRRSQQRLERPRQRAADGARAFAELQAEQRRGQFQFQQSWRALEGLVPGGGVGNSAPDFDGVDAAPLAALQLAVRTWRAPSSEGARCLRVGVLRAHTEQDRTPWAPSRPHNHG